VIPYAEGGVLKMGRTSSCDVKIEDISVSRCHAFLKMAGGEFYLEDNGSRFGSAVLIKNGLVLTPSFNSAIQIGRTLISFETVVEKKFEKVVIVSPKPVERVGELLEIDMVEFGLNRKKVNASKRLINVFEDMDAKFYLPSGKNGEEVDNTPMFK